MTHDSLRSLDPQTGINEILCSKAYNFINCVQIKSNLPKIVVLFNDSTHSSP